MPDSAHCLRCGRPMAMTRCPGPGALGHKSRGLCTSCYPGVLRRGELDRYPRMRRDRDETLDEVVHLRAQGIRTVPELARRLGMSESGMYNLLWRARRAGDPRA